ncbi:MAG: alpha/beta hydrolase family protein [Vitreimonas sp.]
MRLLILALSAISMCGAASAQTAPPPVEAFGRLPGVIDASISPDGAKLALARYDSGVSGVQIYDIERNQVVRMAAVDPESSLRGVGWADDSYATFRISRTFRPHQVLPGHLRFRGAPGRVDYYRTGVIQAASGESRLLSTNEAEPWADQNSQLIAPIEGDPGFGRMIGGPRDAASERDIVYRIDLRNGYARTVGVRGVNDDTVDYVLDEAGRVVTRTDVDRETNRWRLWVFDGEAPRLLLEDVSEFGVPIAVAGLLADGRLAAIEQDAAGEYYVINAIDRQSGARQTIFERPGFEIDRVIADPWTRRVVGAAWIEEERQQHFFDPDLQSIYERAKEAFGAGFVVLTSWSRDRSRAVLYAERGLDGGAYYLFTPAGPEIRRIAQLYPELSGAALGERLALTFRARDGERVPAYLTLPPGREARNLPLVALVHGGPASRDTFDFDYQAAFLASRGYAVLQVNFRGSSGYGSTWENAGRRQWGGLMQTDVEDGVAALGRSGRIDPSRVCIVGASYGGYAALAGVSLTPDRYRCAISIAGVSDLMEMIDAERAQTGRYSISTDYWRSSIGDRQEDRDRIRAVSPAFLADRVTAPVLLMHGTDDTVVPIDQSRRMERALTRAGKQVRFVELRGDDHYLSDAETRIATLREMEAFLAQHLAR